MEREAARKAARIDRQRDALGLNTRKRR